MSLYLDDKFDELVQKYPEQKTRLLKFAFMLGNATSVDVELVFRTFEGNCALGVLDWLASSNRYLKVLCKETFIIPEGVTHIPFGSFRAVGVRELRIPSSVTRISNSTFSCFNELERIIVSPDNPICTSKDGVLYSKDFKTLLKYPSYRDTPKYSIQQGTEVIGSYAFLNSYYLYDIDIPNTVHTLGEHCFEACCSLREVLLPESVKILESDCFYSTSGLYSVAFPSNFTCEDKDMFLFSPIDTVIFRGDCCPFEPSDFAYGEAVDVFTDSDKVKDIFSRDYRYVISPLSRLSTEYRDKLSIR